MEIRTKKLNKCFAIALYAFVNILLLASCNAQTSSAVDAQAFQKKTTEKHIQILDVRNKEEFDKGHIENALLADWNDKTEFNRRTQHLDKSKPVLIYCLSGYRSQAAAIELRNNGYTVTELQGGINAWRSQKLPLISKQSLQGLSIDSFNTIIKSNNYVIVDFGAKWCAPCKKTEPIIDSIAAENKSIFILKIDADKDAELCTHFNISSFPTFFIYKNGVKVNELKGVVTKEQLIAK
jgi:thioredoxin